MTHAACGSGDETPLTFDEPVNRGHYANTGDPASREPHDSDGFRFETSAGTVVALRVEIEMPNREVIFWVTQLSLLDASGGNVGIYLVVIRTAYGWGLMDFSSLPMVNIVLILPAS